jgi:hypothetical protein
MTVAVAAGTLDYSSGNLTAAQVQAGEGCIVEVMAPTQVETVQKRMPQGGSTASVKMFVVHQTPQGKASGQVLVLDA